LAVVTPAVLKTLKRHGRVGGVIVHGAGKVTFKVLKRV
jgi:hypothetical protein